MGNNPANRDKFGAQNNLLVGFQNKPLTLCYANSILQVLFHHPIFANIVSQSQQSEGILYYLRQVLQNMRKQKRMQSVSTNKMMKYIQAESQIFQRQRHQDCHEFYIWLMNQINDQIKGKDKKKITPLEQQFFSKRITRTECLTCHTISERQEEEVDLSLIIPEPNVSLNYQKLDGNDKFKCDKCGNLQVADKKTLIKTLPNFLSIHLRRFKYDEVRRGIIKLNWQVPFPFKLKLRPNHTQKQEADAVYKLVGVVVHLGTGENYGHYLSYIKIGVKWFIFNDDEISQTEDYMLESLWGYKGLTKCAYMLFYSL